MLWQLLLLLARHIQVSEYQFHQELHLRYEEIEVLQLEQVLPASDGDIVTTLQDAGRRHALVIDNDVRTGQDSIRGIFSATQISKQRNRPVETSGFAHTFAEVVVALHG